MIFTDGDPGPEIRRKLNEMTGIWDAAVLNAKGWSPVLGVVTDGERRVHRLVDWTGGVGAKPAVGSYIGPSGLVATAALATDLRGATGLTGSVGPANSLTIGTVSEGPAAATITGTAPAQTLSLVVPKGNQGIQGVQGVQGIQGVKGDKGDKGDTGVTGAAATVTVGTTTTGAAGTNASVSNSGTSAAATFNFTIPRGNTGLTGPANSLSIGTVTSSATPSATITGTAPSQVLNLVLAKGDTGAKGDKGDPGSGDMLKSENLSGLTNTATARTNIGLGNVSNTSDAAKPVSTATAAALDAKVDKVTGKQLSTEDYTTAEKTKLAGVATAATANATNAQLRDRATHTGTQATSTVAGLDAALAAKAPLTGAGTSGTWDIGITGNAATATKLATVRTINGVAFDGSGNIAVQVSWTDGITGKPAVIASGADMAEARAAIGAGTSNLTLGTSAGTALAGDTSYQAPLVSGTNIKTVNGASLLGSGDITVGDVTLTSVQTLTNKTISGGVYSGVIDDTGSARSGIVAVAALAVDCSLGNYFTKTISSNSTLTFSNAPASRAYAFTLEITHSAGTITWPTSVQWPGSTAPTLTTGKTHLFTFVTDDGGTRWRGVANVNYTN